MRHAIVDQLKGILATGHHPDGRALGGALAQRLAGALDAPRRKGGGDAT